MVRWSVRAVRALRDNRRTGWRAAGLAAVCVCLAAAGIAPVRGVRAMRQREAAAARFTERTAAMCATLLPDAADLVYRAEGSGGVSNEVWTVDCRSRGRTVVGTFIWRSGAGDLSYMWLSRQPTARPPGASMLTAAEAAQLAWRWACTAGAVRPRVPYRLGKEPWLVGGDSWAVLFRHGTGSIVVQVDARTGAPWRFTAIHPRH